MYTHEISALCSNLGRSAWTRGGCRIRQKDIRAMKDWAVALIAAALMTATIIWCFFVIISFWP